MVTRSWALPVRISVAALVGAVVLHVVGVLTVGDGYNVYAVVFEIVLLIAALLAATRRWWALAIAGLFSGFLGNYTLINQADLLTGDDVAKAVVMVLFASVTLTAGLSALWASARAFSSRRTVQAHPS